MKAWDLNSAFEKADITYIHSQKVCRELSYKINLIT
jgi:hypothetical protein